MGLERFPKPCAKVRILPGAPRSADSLEIGILGMDIHRTTGYDMPMTDTYQAPETLRSCQTCGGLVDEVDNSEITAADGSTGCVNCVPEEEW